MAKKKQRQMKTVVCEVNGQRLVYVQRQVVVQCPKTWDESMVSQHVTRQLNEERDPCEWEGYDAEDIVITEVTIYDTEDGPDDPDLKLT